MLSFVRAYSSVGRAPVLHTGGHRFESCCAHTNTTSAGVVQLVRAPACHAGSCGFKPRLPRVFYIVVLAFSLSLSISCSGPSIDDFRYEGDEITRALIIELKRIRTSDDLLSHFQALQHHFNALADVMIRAQAFELSHPDASPATHRQEGELAEQLRFELNRVLRLEGGRQVIERAQEEALSRLDRVTV